MTNSRKETDALPDCNRWRTVRLAAFVEPHVRQLEIDRLSHEIIFQRAMLLLTTVLFTALGGALLKAHRLLDFRAVTGCVSV